MKRTLESPKIVVYENVEKIKDVLEFYMNDCVAETVALEILGELGLSKGKKTVIKLFKNNVQAIIESGWGKSGLTFGETSRLALEAFKSMKLAGYIE